MAKPRITSMYTSDIFFVYLYIHFGAGCDFLFRIDVKKGSFLLEKSFIFKISNPFFGVSPISVNTPHCHHWCCVTVATYAKKSFLKFYEIEHEKLIDKKFKPYGETEANKGNIHQKNIDKNIGSINDSLSFTTNYIMNITGKVEDILFDYKSNVGFDDLSCLILMENGDVMNITISRLFKVQINNLYLSSRELQLSLRGNI